MISKQTTFENAKVLPSLSIYILTIDHGGMCAVEVIDVRVILPRDYLALPVVNGFHCFSLEIECLTTKLRGKFLAGYTLRAKRKPAS
jgi:hypothetical protein